MTSVEWKERVCLQMEGKQLMPMGLKYMPNRMVNLGSSNDCFELLDMSDAKFGVGSNMNPLEPFVSIGVFKNLFTPIYQVFSF